MYDGYIVVIVCNRYAMYVLINATLSWNNITVSYHMENTAHVHILTCNISIKLNTNQIIYLHKHMHDYFQTIKIASS